ncbi:MAG: chemotaxis protein CheX [Planctomycetes bacterium]|nr:chemotaxis protein CheX [Planctomycetota bacterium]
MSVAEPETVQLPIAVEPTLIEATINSVNSALAMCETSAKCVSISTVPNSNSGIVTGMIGVHGKVSGFITVNMAERVALCAVQGLLQESYPKLSSQVVDGVGEITNIIVGGIKAALGKTQWAFSNITVPSVIVGTGYQIAYARGLEFLCATFEHDDPEAIMLNDRMLQVSISLLRL